MDYNNIYSNNFNMFNIKTVDGKIYQNTYTGEQQIGYTVEAYQELEKIATEATSKAEEYYNLLEQHNLITKPKSQDEINKELTSSINSLADLVNQLQNSFKEITDELSKPNIKQTESITTDVKQSKTSNRNGNKVSE